MSTFKRPKEYHQYFTIFQPEILIELFRLLILKDRIKFENDSEKYEFIQTIVNSEFLNVRHYKYSKALAGVIGNKVDFNYITQSTENMLNNSLDIVEARVLEVESHMEFDSIPIGVKCKRKNIIYNGNKLLQVLKSSFNRAYKIFKRYNIFFERLCILSSMAESCPKYLAEELYNQIYSERSNICHCIQTTVRPYSYLCTYKLSYKIKLLYLD